MSDKVARLDCCQYLLVSQINYTLTNFADHRQRFSHDAVNRYLRVASQQPFTFDPHLRPARQKVVNITMIHNGVGHGC